MKAFALLTAAMLFSLIFSATATTVFYEPTGYTKVDGYMDMNLSFIAPSPINYTLVPVMAPHEIYLGSNEFFIATEM